MAPIHTAALKCDVEGLRICLSREAHLAKLTRTFAPKFPVLPPEMVRHILTFGFHAGYY